MIIWGWAVLSDCQHLCSKHHPNICYYLRCSSKWAQGTEQLPPVTSSAAMLPLVGNTHPFHQGVERATQSRAAINRNQRSDDGEGHCQDRDGEETVQIMAEQDLEGKRKKQQWGVSCTGAWKGKRNVENAMLFMLKSAEKSSVLSRKAHGLFNTFFLQQLNFILTFFYL